MPTSFRQFVARDALANAALNAVMNGAYAAFMWRGEALVALHDGRCVALDLANTPIMIALLSTLLGTAAARKRLRSGRVDVSGARAPEVLRLLPSSIALRALLLSLLAALLLAAPLWLTLYAAGGATLPVAQAVGLKVFVTVAMTLAIAPLVTWAALADVQPPLPVSNPLHQPT